MNTSNVYRNKTMNAITEADVGSTLRIAGWVENIRDHGGVSFIDLRDMRDPHAASVGTWFTAGRWGAGVPLASPDNKPHGPTGTTVRW